MRRDLNAQLQGIDFSKTDWHLMFDLSCSALTRHGPFPAGAERGPHQRPPETLRPAKRFLSLVFPQVLVFERSRLKTETSQSIHAHLQGAG